jgi:hypothetical protein
MIKAKFLLEIDEMSLTMEANGHESALVALLVTACEMNPTVEELMNTALDFLTKKRVEDATSGIH